MEREINLTLDYIKAIQEAAAKAERRGTRLKEGMKKWEEEKAEWCRERTELLAKIEKLEKELKMAATVREMSKEEKIKLAEDKLEAEIRQVSRMKCGRWRREGGRRAIGG